jgi:ribosomal protein S2
MKLQKHKFSKDLIKYLLNSKVHVGLINYFAKSDINFYLYGFRNKVCIFNLFSTYYSLKQLFYLFIETLKKDKKIVFVFSPTLLRKHFYFLNLISKNKYVFLENNREKNVFYLTKNVSRIGLIFLFNNLDRRYIITLNKSLHLPLIGFTSNTITSFDYPVVGNFQSLKSNLYFYRLLFYIVKIVELWKRTNFKKLI